MRIVKNAVQSDLGPMNVRKLYTTPRLVQYGSAKMLTLGTVGSGTDMQGTQATGITCVNGGATKTC